MEELKQQISSEMHRKLNDQLNWYRSADPRKVSENLVPAFMTETTPLAADVVEIVMNDSLKWIEQQVRQRMCNSVALEVTPRDKFYVTTMTKPVWIRFKEYMLEQVPVHPKKYSKSLWSRGKRFNWHQEHLEFPSGQTIPSLHTSAWYFVKWIDEETGYYYRANLMNLCIMWDEFSGRVRLAFKYSLEKTYTSPVTGRIEWVPAA